MKKVYDVPKLRFLIGFDDVITSSVNGSTYFEDEESLGKNDRIWSGF